MTGMKAEGEAVACPVETLTISLKTLEREDRISCYKHAAEMMMTLSPDDV